MRYAIGLPGEPERLVADARTTLSNFIRDPDQTWIQDNLGRARALLIAPQVVRAGFIFGARGGVASSSREMGALGRDQRFTIWRLPAWASRRVSTCRRSLSS